MNNMKHKMKKWMTLEQILEKWIPNSFKNIKIETLTFLYKNNLDSGIGFNIKIDEDFRCAFEYAIHCYQNDQKPEDIKNYIEQLENWHSVFDISDKKEVPINITSLIFANIYYCVLYGLIKDDEYNGISFIFSSKTTPANLGGYKLKAKESLFSIYSIPEENIII